MEIDISDMARWRFLTGKYKDMTFEWVLNCDESYTRWILQNRSHLSPSLLLYYRYLVAIFFNES